MNNDDALRYPIGKFIPQDLYSLEDIDLNINRIESLPAKIETLAASLTEAKLDTPYREGGWTIRQVLHHLPDSHTNAYIRIKWTLTEDTPIIKAYDEKAWAETPETKLAPTVSIALLKALHSKLTMLLRGMKRADMDREFIHPETMKKVSIVRLIALYAWHGDHHLGHIKIVANK